MEIERLAAVRSGGRDRRMTPRPTAPSRRPDPAPAVARPPRRLAPPPPAGRRHPVARRDRPGHAHHRRDARGPGPADPQGPRPARHQRDDPVLRGLHADPRQLRGRGQEPVRATSSTSRPPRRPCPRASPSWTRSARSRRWAPTCWSCATRVSGAPYLAAEVFGGSVLNGGDGWHAHPTQALLDLYTLRSRLPGGSLDGAQGRDPRRRAPLPGGALQHLDPDGDGRGPVAVRPVHAAARVRGLGGARGGRAGGSR